MMKDVLKKACLMLMVLCCGVAAAWNIGGDGLYVLQDFEDQTTFPETKPETETAFNVEGQGEWLYLNAFVSTNSSYVNSGSQNLRLAKNGSYVISPVLSNGVSKVTFYLGRNAVKVYTSTDEGASWTAVETTTSGKIVTATINSNTVNRIKVANESSKDSDIDDLSIFAQTYETPVTLTTGDATDITKTTATLSGQVTKQEATITEVGFVWSNTNKEPTLNDQVVASSSFMGSDFTVNLTDLAEGRTVYYRAYAKYGSTQTYGEVKSFKTLQDEVEQTVDAEGRYFVQDFEDQTTYPGEDGKNANTELTYNVLGGEWIYYNSYISTNTSYNVNGSTANLRLPKNGTYVVTPVLNSGVKKVTWNQMRKTCVAYTSTDGGKTWTSATFEGGTDGALCTLTVENLNVNRIKIANEASGDADIDNLIVFAQAFGTPATVATGDAEGITKNQAMVSAQIVDAGDQPITEAGFFWSTTNANPSQADNSVIIDDLKKDQTEFSALITGLKAEQKVYYRAYALSNAGYAFGETKDFTTSEATVAVVATSDVTMAGKKYRLGGIVTDDGGLELTEVGIIYGKTAGLDYNNGTRETMSKPSYKFSTSVQLEEATQYYVRAYAITAKGTAYGEEKAFVTQDIPETPDDIKGDEIWCSPDGNDATADGSEQNPFYDLQKAVDIAQPGDRIWMKAGTYVYDKRININDTNGEPDKMIELFGKGGQAVLDFSGMPYHAHSGNPLQGIRHTSSYWHFKNIDITNASDNGMLIERNKPTGGSASDILNHTQDGHDNIIELCNFYKNGDTGLQMKNLAANNKVINCDSYLNCDEDEGDADGFAPKLSVGDNNYFYGCRAWANSDDGWDVFYKKEGGFGDNMTVIIENSISYKNGFLALDKVAPKGNGNGFKCGSNQGAMNVFMNRCLAVYNKAKGFDQNHNAGDIILNNCTGITNTSVLASSSDKTYSYRIYEAIASGHEVRLTNCIAINDNDATDKRDSSGQTKPSEHGKNSQWGRFEIDETLSGLTATNCEFQKAHPDFFIDVTNHEELIGPRDEDGNLPETTFAHIKKEASHKMYDGSTVTSDQLLIDKGVQVEATTYRGIAVNGIEFVGEAPDLGAYEYDGEISNGIKVISQESADNSVRLFQAQNGVLFVTVNDAAKATDYTVYLYDTAGHILGQHAFNGATTAIRLPQGAKGMVVLKVESNKGFKGAAKAMVK